MTLEGIIPGGGAGSKRGHPGGEVDGRGKKRWKKNKKVGPGFLSPVLLLSGSFRSFSVRSTMTGLPDRRHFQLADIHFSNALQKQFEMPVHIFQPHELYNPAEPNDLQLYKEYRKAKREETRVRRKEEEERKQRGSESEASYYSEDEREEQEVRRDGESRL
jgi:hypothetical protein